MSITRDSGLSPVDAVHNDAVTEWTQDYDAWLNDGLHCMTTTGHLTPAEWDRWKTAHETKGYLLLGIARALFGAELGEYR